jgi:hypothetical protein
MHRIGQQSYTGTGQQPSAVSSGQQSQWVLKSTHILGQDSSHIQRIGRQSYTGIGQQSSTVGVEQQSYIKGVGEQLCAEGFGS